MLHYLGQQIKIKLILCNVLYMDNIIENIYLKNNLPGFENLYKLVKAAGHSEIKKKDINFYSTR